MVNEQEYQDQILGVIEALLDCPEGQELQILREYVIAYGDVGISVLLNPLAVEAQEAGNQIAANKLKRLSEQVETARLFLLDILPALGSNDDDSKTHPLSIYREHLNEDLLLALPIVGPLFVDASHYAILPDVSYGESECQLMAQMFRNFGDLLRKFPVGENALHLELAIQLYQLSLKAYAPDKSLEEWALIQSALGFAYLDRERGDKAQNIELAIKGWEQLSIIRTEDELQELWALIQYTLASAYTLRIEGVPAENAEKTIRAYQQALEIYEHHTYPEKWADCHSGLASAYLNRLYGDRHSNTNKAIAACNCALQVYTQSKFPEEWAKVQQQLGRSYKARIDSNRADNIQTAIKFYEKALKIYNQVEYPEEWAAIQLELAIAYVLKVKGDQASNIDKAISFCSAAQDFFDYQTYPEEWAMIQSTKALAYLARTHGNKANNIEKVIEFYNESLKVYKQESHPKEWANIQKNLAIAYTLRIEGKSTQNAEDSITFCNKALEIYSPTKNPEEWASVQFSLAKAFRIRKQNSRKENLERVIEACHNALKIYKQEISPIPWASVQFELAMAYTERVSGDRKHNVEQAVQAFKEALKVFSVDYFPQYGVAAGWFLGNFAFEKEDWDEAIVHYGHAITAVERSRSWTSNEKQRLRIQVDTVEVYQQMVRACIKDGQFSKAFETTERARARRLVELMHSNNLAQGTEIPSDIQKLLTQYESLQEKIDQQIDRHNTSASAAGRDNIESLIQQKEQLFDQLRSRDKVLAEGLEVDSFAFHELSKLISDQSHSAVLSFYSTKDLTYVFVIRYTGDDLACLLHICPDQGIDTLQNWVWDNWLASYDLNTPSIRTVEESDWFKTMPDRLTELANRLQINQLIKNHLSGINDLILIPHLTLHLIPFAALPIDDGNKFYLGDQFRIRIVPSAQILNYCYERENNNFAVNVTGLQFGSVEDASGDRSIVRAGFEQIAQNLNIPDEQRLRGPQEATIHNYRQLVLPKEVNPLSKEVKALHSIHHAASDLEKPLESALQLADGRITLGQLLTPSWRLPHVVDVFLACCETNLGAPNITDEVLTLSTGFLCAGARSVTSTLWSVNALSTVLFCNFYYKFRKQGHDRPTALQQAQQAMRQPARKLGPTIQVFFDRAIAQTTKKSLKERLDNLYRYHVEQIRKAPRKPLFEHPFYWAGFISQGLR